MFDQDQDTNTSASKEDNNTETTDAPSSPATVDGELAPLGPRIGAALIDCAVMMGISIVGIICGQILGILSLLFFLVNIAYFLLRDALPFLDGKSVGKKVLGLRAVTAEGKSLSGDFKSSALRNVPMLIAIVELVVLIIKKDSPEAGLRLGDQLANTKVISAK